MSLLLVLDGYPRTASPSKGALALNGKVPLITLSQTAQPANGHSTDTGYAPSVGAAQTIAPGVAHELDVGHAPSVYTNNSGVWFSFF